MKRQCTEEENQIIRALVSEKVPNQTFSNKNRSVIIPVILGFILGLVIAIPIAMALNTTNKRWVRLVLVFSIFIMENVCIIIWRKRQGKKTGKKRKREISTTGAFQINGGTIINYSGSRDGSWLLFAEDDSLDSFGKPYKIQYPVYGMGDVKSGDRIILVYSNSGDYIPLCVDALTKEMIPMENPSYFESADWNNCTTLPHPNATRMDRVAYKITQGETLAFAKKVKGWKGIQTKHIFGYFMLSVLVFMILALIFIFLMAGDVIKTPAVALVIVIGLIVLWGLLSFGFPRLIRTWHSRILNKLCFRKLVVFHNITTAVTDYDVPIKEINVYEYEHSTIKMISYPVNSNVFLPKNLCFGALIYKYSSKIDTKTTDLNYFGEVDERYI